MQVGATAERSAMREVATIQTSTIDEHTPVKYTRVLVVDDDPDVNYVIRNRIASHGYLVDSAENGEEALERMAKILPDLVIVDVAMPGMNGLDLLQRIRESFQDVAVIITTAFGSERVVIDALRRGADDYLRKPFELSELRTVLERTTTRLRLHRQNTELRNQLDQKRRQLEDELAMAANVQSDLLPRELPSIPGFELAAACVPALEVGGDFYDWQEPCPGVLSLWICDVMGKGFGAALLMATVRAVMRAVIRHSSPSEAMQYVRVALEPDLLRSDRFVTLFLGRLDATNRQMTYIDAGHGYAFVLRANGEFDTLAPRGLPLGVPGAELYQEGVLTFSPGDVLVLYSDGLVDARPDLGLDHRGVAHYIAQLPSAAAIVERLVALLAPIGKPPDDMTLVVLRCLP